MGTVAFLAAGLARTQRSGAGTNGLLSAPVSTVSFRNCSGIEERPFETFPACSGSGEGPDDVELASEFDFEPIGWNVQNRPESSEALYFSSFSGFKSPNAVGFKGPDENILNLLLLASVLCAGFGSKNDGLYD